MNEVIDNYNETVRMAKAMEIVGKRMKAARESLDGVSQGKLVEKINLDKYALQARYARQSGIKDPKKRAGVVQKVVQGDKDLAEARYKNWELGNNPADIRWIPLVCKALGCDAGYLFGEYDEKTRDHNIAKETTGLSIESIDEIISHRNNGDDKGLEILSKLLTNRKFWAALAYINMAQYAESGIDKPMSDTLQEQVLKIEMVNMVERHPGATIPTAEQVRDMNLYHASQKFSECISEIVDMMAKENRPNSER